MSKKTIKSGLEIKKKDLHEQKLVKITNFFKKYDSKQPLSFKKKIVSHMMPKTKDSVNQVIDFSEFDDIIKIDAKNKICEAESGVSFSRIVDETLKYNLTPIIVPELKTITIGGAVAGCSIESQSYKYGGFHDTCLEYEVVDAKGNVLTCTPNNKNKELFHMLHGTFGTLGKITKIKFRLCDAKPYVFLKYKTYTSLEEYQKAIIEYSKNQKYTFIDGIIFNKDCYKLCLGNFVGKAPYTSSYDKTKVFYKSVKKRKQDYFRLADYYFRYDADCHWITRNYFLTNPVIRQLFGKFFLGSTKLLKLAKKINSIIKLRPEIVVDVFIPISNFISFMKTLDKKYSYYPIWIVPYMIKKPYPWVNNEYTNTIKKDKLIIDVAIYGLKQKKNKNYYRELEQELFKVNGIKTLISYNYYSKKEFWSIWNKPNYSKLKQKHDPDNLFLDLYDKTHRN